MVSKLSNGWEGRVFYSTVSPPYTDRAIYAGETRLAEYIIDKIANSRWVIHADCPKAVERIQAAIKEFDGILEEARRLRVARHHAEAAAMERKRRDDANRAALSGGDDD